MFWDSTLCVDMGIPHQCCNFSLTVELPASLMFNRGGSIMLLVLLCLKHIPNATDHYICKNSSEQLVHIWCTAHIAGGGSCWLCPQCSTQNLVFPLPKFWVFGSDWVQLHIQETALLVVGVHFCSRHGKLRRENPVLLLEIGILLHNFLQPYPQLIWRSSTLTETLQSYIEHNCQSWQLLCCYIRLPSGISHWVTIFLLAEIYPHFNGVAQEFYLWPYPWMITWYF